MRNTAFLVAGIALLLVQANLFRVLGPLHIAGLVPSLVLPLILFMGVHEYSVVRGASVSFVLGYATDLIGIVPIGLYTFTYVTLFILGRAAGVRLAAQTMMMQVGLVLCFALVHSVMMLILSRRGPTYRGCFPTSSSLTCSRQGRPLRSSSASPSAFTPRRSRTQGAATLLRALARDGLRRR
jgi:rod shape-determining protein MreD